MGRDAIVVGAGIVGAAIARALARAGMDVVIVDRGQPASGTSASCEGNLLVSDKPPGHELVLAQYASRLWRATAGELSDQLGPSFPAIEYERKGGLVVATTEAGASALSRFAAAQRDAGVDAREVGDPYAYEPELTSEVSAAVYYPDDAQVQPTVAAEALLASARAYGARVMTGFPVTGPVLDRDGGLAGVRSGSRTLHARRVVVAAGPWSAALNAKLGVSMPVLPRRGELLVTAPLRQRVFHKVYGADYVGAVESDDGGLQTSSVVESTRGGTMLLGSSRQRVGFDERLRVDVLQQIAAKAVHLFPFLRDVAVLRSYGGFRPYMPDHLPVISADHRLPGLWQAVGHEGAGVGLSLATAELVRDLMLGVPPALDAAPFSTERPSLLPHLDDVPERVIV